MRVGKNGIRRKAPEASADARLGRTSQVAMLPSAGRPSQVNRQQSTVLRIGIPAKIVQGRKA
ncbi:hypothetical protein RJ60_13580 [Mesotoga sp. B105.6.4]|nr:hypothetical protein RJ60_13580 [Mesotoga sp. B105.6.4]